jgi:methionyl aminopeptidase
MTVIIKSTEDIEMMRIAGRLAAEVLEYLDRYVKAGITTNELNSLAHEYITEVQQATPAPLNYHGFPKSICTSVNHVVCHGIPNDKALKNGDIVNIDVTVIKNGFHGDTSKMYTIGDIPPYAQRLIDVTQKAMYLAIDLVKPGVHLGDIGAAIQQYAESQRYSVVREYCGHGIGRDFHEDGLQVLHYGKSGTGLVIEAGMTFTIEPMINLGRRHVKLLGDEWTVVTKDRKLSAQWEHTLVVTEEGCEVLTLRQEEIPCRMPTEK